MASGFSWSGGVPRCFAYWQEFQKCYAQSDHPSQCRFQAADYTECLHRPKEMARAAVIEAELKRQVEKATKDHKKAADALTDGVVVGVGLIKRGGDDSEPSK